MTQSRLIAVVGIVAWLMVGVPAIVRHAGAPPVDLRWTAAFAVLTASLLAPGLAPTFSHRPPEHGTVRRPAARGTAEAA